jgi:type IV pilus assembly protein PilC
VAFALPRLPFLRSRIKATQKIFLVQQMHIMAKAGVPLTTTLKTLEAQATGQRLREVLEDLAARIEKGQSLADALQPYVEDFGELMVNMIAAGEASGRLEEVLDQVYLQMKKDHEIVSRVRGALMYPMIVVLAMLGIGTGMIVFVIPKLTAIFKESSVELPLPTKILIAVSDGIVNHGLLVSLGAVASFSLFLWGIHRPRGRYAWHWLLLKLPVAGPIIRKVNVARFSRTVSSFLKTDIPIVKTLTTTANVLGNVHYRQALVEASERIVKGITLEAALRPYPQLFNPTILQMVAVGEQSGALDDILSEAAEFYEGEVTQTMATLPSLLEPVLMVLLGVGVGGMAVAIILPLYTLTQAF